MVHSVQKDSNTSFVILIASADEKQDEKHPKAFDNVDITVRYGDHSSALKKVVEKLTEAKKYAGVLRVSNPLKGTDVTVELANENQAKVMEGYIERYVGLHSQPKSN